MHFLHSNVARASSFAVKIVQLAHHIYRSAFYSSYHTYQTFI